MNKINCAHSAPTHISAHPNENGKEGQMKNENSLHDANFQVGENRKQWQRRHNVTNNIKYSVSVFDGEKSEIKRKRKQWQDIEDETKQWRSQKLFHFTMQDDYTNIVRAFHHSIRVVSVTGRGFRLYIVRHRALSNALHVLRLPLPTAGDMYTWINWEPFPLYDSFLRFKFPLFLGDRHNVLLFHYYIWLFP